MNDVIAKNKIKLKNIPGREIIVATICLWGQYEVFSLSLFTIIASFVVLYHIIRYKPFVVFKPLLLLFVFMLFHDIIKNFFVSVNIINWCERIILMLFLSTIIGNVDKEKLYSVWKIIGIVAMIGLFVQAVQVYLLGQSVGMINILPFLQSEAKNFSKEYMRPHSFFLEPASYATWILPLLYMSLQRKKIIFSSIVTFSILLSSSVIGIVLAGVLWIYNSLVGVGQYQTRRNALIMLSIIVCGIILFLNLSLFSKSLDKMQNTSVDNTSDFVRVALAFELYGDLKPAQKVVGISYDNVKDYLQSGEENLRSYNLTDDLSYLGFVNSLGNALLHYGIIGLFLYINLFYKFYMYLEKHQKAYVLICVISIFAQSSFWNNIFVLQMSVLLANIIVKDNVLYFGTNRDRLINDNNI